MRQILVILLLAFSSLSFAQQPSPCCGKIIRIENFSSRYVSARNVDIWLPDGYTPKEKYAVLYMHDGQMLYDSTVTWNRQEWMVDEVVSKLISDHLIKKIIVVGIWNDSQNRHADYFPQKSIVNLDDKTKQGLLALFPGEPKGDRYLKFLVDELKPYIDSHFATLPDKKNTFIAGSSMGGLISMYAICEYPEIFGGAACMSTHWIGNFSSNPTNPIPNAIIRYMKEHLPSPIDHKIYFDYGSKTLDSLYKPWQQKVDNLMIKKGFTSKSWITREFIGEDHSERAWQRRLHIPLEFIIPKN